MKYSNYENEYLVELLNSAIKSTEVKQPSRDIDWESFVQLAKRQQVYSVIAPVLGKINMPSEQTNELMLYNNNELVRLIAMKSEQQLLEAELEKNGIAFMLLKGGLIREYYPQQKMRQMSDVDILYDDTKREVLFDIMSRHNYKIMSCSENSDDFFKEPYYTFEFHRELFFKEHDFYCDFSNVWDNAAKSDDNSCKYIMSNEDLYLHSIAHMNKHYRFGGFGIRFLADTYLLLTKNWESMDKAYIRSRLDDFGLTEFEQFTRELTLEIFGNRVFNEEQIDFLNNSLDFGIYGNTEGITVYFDEYKKKNSGKASIAGFFLAKLFPSADFMKRNYSVLEKKPFLLPFFYIYRLADKILHKSKVSVHNYKVLKKYIKK